MDKSSLNDLFPSVPTSLETIREFFAKSDLTPQELAEFLETQPVLSLHVLHLVNSPYYSLKKSVTSIKQAVLLLGNTIIRGIILASIIKKTFDADLSPYQISLEELDQLSKMRATLIEKMFRIKQFENIDKQYILSIVFLMENGKLITSHLLKQQNLQEKFQDALAQMSIEEAEKELIGYNSYDILAELLEAWNFEAEFAEVFSNVLNPKNEEQKLIYLLSQLINLDGVLTHDQVDKSVAQLETYGIDKEIFLELTDDLTKEI